MGFFSCLFLQSKLHDVDFQAGDKQYLKYLEECCHYYYWGGDLNPVLAPHDIFQTEQAQLNTLNLAKNFFFYHKQKKGRDNSPLNFTLTFSISI